MHTQKKKKLKITLPVLAVALFLQMRWRSVIFPEFFSHLQFLRNREGSKEKRKKKDLGVSNTTYSNSQSDTEAALADFFDLAALSKNKRQ